MVLLGVRDWSIGLAIGWFWLRGEGRSMAVVILSGMVLCVADIFVIWRRRGGDAVSWAFGAGVAVWGAIGWGLWKEG